MWLYTNGYTCRFHDDYEWEYPNDMWEACELAEAADGGWDFEIQTSEGNYAGQVWLAIGYGNHPWETVADYSANQLLDDWRKDFDYLTKEIDWIPRPTERSAL
jgi:hypothetical protein